VAAIFKGKSFILIAATKRVGLIQVLAVRGSSLGAKRLVASSAALMLLSGCARQTVTLSPEINGSLIINGNPAKNAEVFVGFSGDHTHPCPAAPQSRTDALGGFHLPAVTARHTARSIQSRPYTTTQNYLCFKYQGELIVGNLTLTELSDTKRYFVECRAPVPQNAVAEDGLVCQWRTANNSFKPNPLRSSKGS
jgi:hypothetical protein